MRNIHRASIIAIAVGMAFRDEAVEGQTGASAPAAVAVAPTTDGATVAVATPATAPAAETPEQVAAAAAVAAAENEKLHTTIKANFDNKVDVQDTNFHFRKVKDPETKLETKRPTVTIPVPAPSVEGLIAIIEAGGKSLDLLLEAVRDKVLEQAREYINDNEGVSAANFPYEKLGWDFIANLPKAERRGGGIAKELWDDFAKDYVEIMPALTGKTKESVELAAKVFVSKFANAKTNKPVLKLLEQQLGIYINATTQGEQFAPVVEWLSNKLDTLINTDETSLLLNL